MCSYYMGREYIEHLYGMDKKSILFEVLWNHRKNISILDWMGMAITDIKLSHSPRLWLVYFLWNILHMSILPGAMVQTLFGGTIEFHHQYCCIWRGDTEICRDQSSFAPCYHTSYLSYYLEVS